MRTYNRKPLLKTRQRRSGFTLLEVLIVLAIIGVIAAMAVPQLLGQANVANERQTRSAILNLEQAAELYAVNNGFEPPAGGQDAIQMMMTKDQESGASAVLDKLPVDAWGEPLNYEYPNTKADTDRPAIWSSGKNRQNENGSGDDINNWDDIAK
ncbi:Type II secretion system protein G precursor [Thalassoglobus neptunius]|uniref:Type II secretion system protein G n=1 Tax=Thalassoglobus neptunius TaxID=1938619 RepID=A0A5C5WGH8_9PLAN|nr:type II secretion system protein GspG [Thalassoglobus neptunius]TWT49884.1 Type II secretion system protein G precursor [Thalassoglobus neptunius]